MKSLPCSLVKGALPGSFDINCGVSSILLQEVDLHCVAGAPGSTFELAEGSCIGRAADFEALGVVIDRVGALQLSHQVLLAVDDAGRVAAKHVFKEQAALRPACQSFI